MGWAKMWDIMGASLKTMMDNGILQPIPGITYPAIYALLVLAPSKMNNTQIYQAPEGIDMIHDGVKYGKLAELEYDSKTTCGKRKCYVYTPPNYDSAVIYPVLYLLHCGGETHDGWIYNGAANQIISNLIAWGEAKPKAIRKY